MLQYLNLYFVYLPGLPIREVPVRAHVQIRTTKSQQEDIEAIIQLFFFSFLQIGMGQNQYLRSVRDTTVSNNRIIVLQLHFTEDQFEPLILQKYGKKKLKPNAVPTLFSHRPAPKQRKPPAKRCEIRTHLHQGERSQE